MKNNGKVTFQLGDLVAALFDEAAKETKRKKIQSAIVALALLDLHERMRRSKHATFAAHRKAA